MNSVPQSVPMTEVKAPEPIYVFGSGRSGQFKDGTAAIAARFYGAKLDIVEGPTGDAYAIPYRAEDGKLLSARTIAEQVNQFVKHARANPDQQFRVSRIGCERDGYRDSDIAPLFRAAPPNCALPAIWRRELGIADTARVLVFDPLIRLANAQWREQLKHFLGLNMPLWGAAKCELLSVGSSRGVSAAGATAKLLRVPHREIRANAEYYGSNVDAASELLAVWHATHMVNITNPNQTALPSHTRILQTAIRDGVFVDDLDIENFA